jgi:phospholipid-binding lipoprotein MlaA
MNLLSRFRGSLIIIAAAMTMSACATSNKAHDPFEGFNRVMFNFNDTIDQVALKPAATAYESVMPSFVQSGVANFFGNLGDVWTAVNNLLQGKLADGMSDITRVSLNSTFGFLGLLDIGSEAGLSKHKEDFGQTLGEWGVPPGPYVVLPIFGSSTVRDAIVLPIDLQGDPWNHKEPVRWRNVGTAVRMVDARAAVLGASSLIEDAALDKYEFVRDGYLQRRIGLINDGEPVHPALYEYFKPRDDVANTLADTPSKEAVALVPE